MRRFLVLKTLYSFEAESWLNRKLFIHFRRSVRLLSDILWQSRLALSRYVHCRFSNSGLNMFIPLSYVKCCVEQRSCVRQYVTVDVSNND